MTKEAEGQSGAKDKVMFEDRSKGRKVLISKGKTRNPPGFSFLVFCSRIFFLSLCK